MSKAKSAELPAAPSDSAAKVGAPLPEVAWSPIPMPDIPNFSVTSIWGKETVLVEFKSVDYINSTGLRVFARWMSATEKAFPELTIRFDKVPPVLARQLITLKDFLPKRLDVWSLFVPYYCDSCDTEVQSHCAEAPEARVAAHLKDILPKVVVCEKCHSPMTLDIVPDQYLFLLLERSKW